MKAFQRAAYVMDAPVPVRRPKRNLLRRHWLTGAFVFGIVGLTAYTGVRLYQVDARLQQVQATRLQIEEQIQEAQQRKEYLQAELAKVSGDAQMELKAKDMGFYFPGETVYQKGTSSGR